MHACAYVHVCVRACVRACACACACVLIVIDSNELLEEKLQDQNFYEAVMYCGVLVDNLPKRDFDFFKRLPNRARVIDDYHAKMREEEYNTNRMEMLRQVCEREQECIEYQRKRKEKEERYFAGLQAT